MVCRTFLNEISIHFVQISESHRLDEGLQSWEAEEGVLVMGHEQELHEAGMRYTLMPHRSQEEARITVVMVSETASPWPGRLLLTLASCTHERWDTAPGVGSDAGPAWLRCGPCQR